MAIKLYTGTPGAGKTLRSIYDAINLHKQDGRQIFHFGIDGMDEKIIPKAPFDELKDWRKLPVGSVLIVDEAHKFLPVRTPGKPEEWIQALTEIRHFGIELWLVTQDPRNIDAFVRRLIGTHIHLSRKAGLKGAIVTEFQGVSEDPNDYHAQQTATKSPWVYPKHLFSVYKSATLHTVKPKVPLKLILGVLFLIGVLIFLPYAFFSFNDTVFGEDEEKTLTTLQGEASALSSNNNLSNPNSEEIKTPEDWIKKHTPLIPGIPHSAPIYHNLQPSGVPEVYCIAGGEEGSSDRTCSCFTEQATRIPGIPKQLCEVYVKQGYYNPYRPKPQTQIQQTTPTAQDTAPGVVPLESIPLDNF